MKKLYITLLVLVLVSCRSKKFTSETKETVRIDTIYQEKKVIDTLIITKEKEVTKPVYFETVINCDEDQTGKVGSGGNYTKYEIKDGKIFLETNLDSVTNYWQSYYRSQFVNDSINLQKIYKEKQLSEEEIVRYVYPWWVWAIAISSIIFLSLWLWEKFSFDFNV